MSRLIKNRFATMTVGLFLTLAGTAIGQSTERVSVGTGGTEGNDRSILGSISADGRTVAFMSSSDNLVLGDNNGQRDIFVHDRQTITTERVNVTSSGAEGNGDSWNATISADGRFAAFGSQSTNLVSSDTNGNADSFVHDLQTGITECVSVNTFGLPGNWYGQGGVLSADGRFVAFESGSTDLIPGGSNGNIHIFVRDRLLGTTEVVSVDSFGTQGNSWSKEPDISANGRFVSFSSLSSNLAPGSSGGFWQLYVHDRETGETTRVSVSSGGALISNWDCEYHSISADGNFIAFETEAWNLVSGDTNSRSDVFLHNRQSGETERISVDSIGGQLSLDSHAPSLSSDGRFVTFSSRATNLVSGDTNNQPDIFIRDRQTNLTEIVSVDSNGIQANSYSEKPTMSSDGQFVAFVSSANNLVPGDTNSRQDLFVRDRASGADLNAMILTGPFLAPTGVALDLAWFVAPPGSNYWLAYSLNQGGLSVGGHAFDLGAPYSIIANGVNSIAGTGNFSSAPIPTAAAGLTVFFELGARDAGGVLHDSIVHPVTFY